MLESSFPSLHQDDLIPVLVRGRSDVLVCRIDHEKAENREREFVKKIIELNRKVNYDSH